MSRCGTEGWPLFPLSHHSYLGGTTVSRALHDWIERHRARRRKLKEDGAIASVASVGTTASGGRTGSGAVGVSPTQPFATPQRSLVDSDDDTTGVGGLDYDEEDNEEVRCAVR